MEKPVIIAIMVVSVIVAIMIVLQQWNTKTVEGFANSDNIEDLEIPAFDTYVPFESPPDPRYVYLEDVNAYVLPIEYIDLTQPFHRWMYYNFPSYYSPYYPSTYTADKWPTHTYPLAKYDFTNNLYMNHSYDPVNIYQPLFLDRNKVKRTFPYTVTQEHSKIIGPIDTIKVDTNTYPNKLSGFAGGKDSLLFTDGVALDSNLASGRGIMRGLIDNDGLASADSEFKLNYFQPQIDDVEFGINAFAQTEHFTLTDSEQLGSYNVEDFPRSDAFYNVNLPTSYLADAPGSFVCQYPLLKGKCNNGPLPGEDMARFNYVNKYNMGKFRPIGSNRIGRGLGSVTGLDQREQDYAQY